MTSLSVISTAQLMDECCPGNKQYAKVMWHKNKAILVRRFIPFNEVPAIVEQIVTTVLNPETKEFYPELRDFAFRAAFVMAYALVQMPESIEDQYELLYTTDLYDVVMKHAFQAQVQSIRDAVEMCFRTEL